MPYKISHKNSQGCELNDWGNDAPDYAMPWDDTLETNNKVAAYVAANQIEPGDTLKIIEV